MKIRHMNIQLNSKMDIEDIKTNEIELEDALDIMCGPLIRDIEGNEIIDPEILTIVNEAMINTERFEYGGKFESLRSKHSFKKRNK